MLKKQMIALKKIWAFLKTYWYIPVLIIIAVVLKTKDNKVEEILNTARDSHKKQIDAIENAEKEKEKQKIVIEKEYNNAIEKIEENYSKSNETMKKEEKKYIKSLVKEWSDDPDQLAERILMKYDFVYVPKTNNNNSD
jgi:biopolymer transport protein ExbB/TolQ